jgi:hypothetical protein
MPDQKLFEIAPCGDPFNKTGWDIMEYETSYSDQYRVFRGDLSPHQGREKTVAMLRRLYPGCKVRVTR